MKKLLTLTTLFSLTSVTAGIIEPHTLWEKNDLSVCFYERESQLKNTNIESEQVARETFDFVPKKLSKRERVKIKEAVLRNFTPELTGIHFVGFKSCDQMPDADIVVLEGRSKVFLFDTPGFNGRATIGENGIFSIRRVDGVKGFWMKSSKKPTVVLRTTKAGTVIHEFGHIAGLRHEHIHEDSINDENCHKYSVTLDFNKLEEQYDSKDIYTEYDPQSIMNYCWLQTRRNQLAKHDGVILSQKDIDTLRHYYK